MVKRYIYRAFLPGEIFENFGIHLDMFYDDCSYVFVLASDFKK
jgi:hypothetical protein